MSASIVKFFRSFLVSSKGRQTAVNAQSPFFAEGDRFYLNTGKKEILSGPLQKNNRTNIPFSFLLHNDIIGQLPSNSVLAQNGAQYRLDDPSLDRYVTLTPRKVTPIYAHDANLIVSLLDIHVPAHGTASPSRPPLEILEAGTGHGSVTLHLARAIHAANPPAPFSPPPPQQRGNDEKITSRAISGDEQWNTYYNSRRAIIHTIDISPSVSIHAEKLVRGFRRGMYAPHINFYASNVSDWISQQKKMRKGTFSSTSDPFITYAILDLPSADTQLANVASIMRPGGLLVVFKPSVTQLGECVREIKEREIPFELEKTLELGQGMSNGRLWDVRLASIRARSTADKNAILRQERAKEGLDRAVAEDNNVSTASEESTDDTTEDAATVDATDVDERPRLQEQVAADKEVLVCRPKVGEKIVGGGFVALFRKI